MPDEEEQEHLEHASFELWGNGVSGLTTKRKSTHKAAKELQATRAEPPLQPRSSHLQLAAYNPRSTEAPGTEDREGQRPFPAAKAAQGASNLNLNYACASFTKAHAAIEIALKTEARAIPLRVDVDAEVIPSLSLPHCPSAKMKKGFLGGLPQRFVRLSPPQAYPKYLCCFLSMHTRALRDPRSRPRQRREPPPAPCPWPRLKQCVPAGPRGRERGASHSLLLYAPHPHWFTSRTAAPWASVCWRAMRRRVSFRSSTS